MSAEEEIRSAINKLSEQRGDSADWWAFDFDSTAIYQTTGDGREVHILDTVEQSDRNLIVTLHRTIDAQLAILRDCLGPAGTLARLGINPEGDPYGQQPELDLARAINGGVA